MLKSQHPDVPPIFSKNINITIIIVMIIKFIMDIFILSCLMSYIF